MYDDHVTYFAETDARGKHVSFGIKSKDRSRHTYVIGKTGMGKSTLLENMAIQDMRNGEGLAFIDPHGKTAELLLEYVPQSRVKDVLYFAPFDTDYPISFNVMEDVGPDKRHLVASGLMSTFEKIWVDAWSARMAYILGNTLLALLEYPNSTLLGINRMLSDKEYRKAVVANIKDPSVRSFWVEEFARYTDRYSAEATPAIQNKVGQFTSNPLIRNIVGQPHSSFDLRKMMDERKIVIVNLAKGRVGEGNANLLGGMIITKIYLAALSRADVPEERLKKLPPFHLYVDEFQSFANKSFADILSEARKYKLNLTIAHQYIEQMSEEVRAAVFGNVGTMVIFRVGAYDAEVLEKEFAPSFTAEDLVNLGIYQIYLKLMIDGVTSPPFSARTLTPLKRDPVSFRGDVIEETRRQFGRPRSTVEADILRWHEPIPVPVKERDVRGVREDRGNIPRDGSSPRGAFISAPRPSPVYEPPPPRREPAPAPTHRPFARAFQEVTRRESFSTSGAPPVRQPFGGRRQEMPGEAPHHDAGEKRVAPRETVAELRRALQAILGEGGKGTTGTSSPIGSPSASPQKRPDGPRVPVPSKKKEEEAPPAKPKPRQVESPGPEANIPEPREVPPDLLREIFESDDTSPKV